LSPRKGADAKAYIVHASRLQKTADGGRRAIPATFFDHHPVLTYPLCHRGVNALKPRRRSFTDLKPCKRKTSPGSQRIEGTFLYHF
jgi:hypothetical protein